MEKLDPLKRKENDRISKQKYVQNNLEKVKESKRKWRENNPDYNKRYYEKHRESGLKKQKERYESNREEILQQQKEYYKINKDQKLKYAQEYRENNKDKIAKHSSEYYIKNKEKLSNYYKNWLSGSREHIKDYNLKRNYGINIGQYYQMLEKANGNCEICGKSSGDPNIRQQQLNIDHCHTTGKVRGIVCNSCNRGLGYFKDNPLLLEKAKKYLLKDEE